MLLGNEHGIIAFHLQQWLRERSTLLNYTHITCLVSKRKNERLIWRQSPSSSFFPPLCPWANVID